MTDASETTALSGADGGPAADVGLIGLAVMGQNLALNMADHGYRVAVWNRTTSTTTQFIADHPDTPGGLVGAPTLTRLLGLLKTPRKIIVLVKAGPPVDAIVEQLIEAGIEPDDLVVDCGNSQWTDTIRRETQYSDRCRFFGSGVSGGEVGARFGPSLMPGGHPDSWKHLRPIWEAIAAKVDTKTGRPREEYAPGKPVVGGEPCTAYIGPNGAGHYVKMVHNGIEYIDMQLISEAYHLLRELGRFELEELSGVFAEWNRGELQSYLIQITADILQQRDPASSRRFLLDVILDTAGQKGTGKWTSVNALDLGIPANAIAEAVFARCLSALKDQRVAAARKLKGPTARFRGARGGLIAAVRQALYCSKVCAYAQGFQLMAEAQKEYGWTLDFGTIASIWRGGCIIRARFLQKITEAYRRDSALANLMLDRYFARTLAAGQDGWRTVVALAARHGVPAPAFSSALAYYDGYRSARLPANLVQAQRDYFGAHTFERVDSPRGTFFHIDWPRPDRPQLEV
ncbi:MAG: phosphogluconate dehydrogenase (NADP(+)-dependent, decarboxylating) [Candidatus Rokuibacteriota bacterium]|nr:MAG: phosphogluconate dehydrogenase (NADP(+)-dependent, decarboxylating) [Candidatus Rokubacteria bacterium]